MLSYDTCTCIAAKHLVLYEDGNKEGLNLTANLMEWEQERCSMLYTCLLMLVTEHQRPPST